MHCNRRTGHQKWLRATERRLFESTLPLLFCALSAWACTGVLGGDVGSGQEGSGTLGAAADGPIDQAQYVTRVGRLTHSQYDNSTSDLLGIEVTASKEFIADATFAGYDNNLDGLKVEGRLGRDYRRAAEDLAARAVAETRSFDHVVPCDPGAAGCADEFLRDFGLRAFRRPLSDGQLQRYQALFSQGAELVGSGDAFRDGVQTVLEAMLQSPHFLYRAELSVEEDDSGAIILNDYEIASRLSFMLWNTTPDRQLLEAAAAGELHTTPQIQKQALRLLESPRGQEVVLDFHRQWLELSHYANLSKSPELYPGFGPELERLLAEETLEFVRQVTFEEQKGLRSLLTAPYTMANQEVAALYGDDAVTSVEGTAYQRVELAPASRAGVLTQIGFLASHAYADASSPIHRGVFVLHKVLCSEIPPPPGDVDFTLSEEALRAPTKREQVTIQTADPACAACHSLINPVGFAFESFDAVGRTRTHDGEELVDTTGRVSLDTGDFSFDGPVDLIEQLADSDATRNCYAENWLRYAFGRQRTEGDDATISALEQALADDDFTAVDLLLALTEAPFFAKRAPNPTTP